MPPEDRDSRTEKATPRKREEARKQGQVPKSQDLNVAVSLTAIFAILLLFGTRSVGKIKEVVRYHLGSIAEFQLSSETVIETMALVVRDIFSVIWPILLILFIAAVLVNFAQVGFLLSGESIKPSLSKINPLKGLQRIFSLKGLNRFLLGVFKVLAIGSVLVWSLWELLLSEEAGEAYLLLQAQHAEVIPFTLDAVIQMMIRGLVVLIILALLDYAFQRWQHEKDLMMTKQEIKDEVQNMEGDAKLKGKRRKLQIEMLRQNTRQDVEGADVVLGNPTHYSVAIKYDRMSMSAPKCVAKGQDFMALRIRQIAMESNVPIVIKPALARALYQAVEPGQEVPEEFYHAVAEVLAYVYKLAKPGNRLNQTETVPV